MRIPLEAPADRAVNPVVGVILIVGLTVVCSAAFGTFLIGFGSDLEAGADAQATVELDSSVRHDTDGFATLVVRSMPRADRVELTATTTDGSATIADGTAASTAELTERRHGVGDSVTVRKRVDPAAPRDVAVRIVAVAHHDGHDSRVFDRTVIL